MGYFSNGTEGMDYEDRYCSRCVHQDTRGGCTVWLAHHLYNYDECNKPESILHLLIPISENGLDNEQCLMFVNKEPQNALLAAARAEVQLGTASGALQMALERFDKEQP